MSVEDYTIQAWKKMRVVLVSPGKNVTYPTFFFIHKSNSANNLHSHIKGKASHKIVSDGMFPFLCVGNVG